MAEGSEEKVERSLVQNLPKHSAADTAENENENCTGDRDRDRVNGRWSGPLSFPHVYHMIIWWSQAIEVATAGCPDVCVKVSKSQLGSGLLQVRSERANERTCCTTTRYPHPQGTFRRLAFYQSEEETFWRWTQTIQWLHHRTVRYGAERVCFNVRGVQRCIALWSSSTTTTRNEGNEERF